jgi:hypothetical protein
MTAGSDRRRIAAPAPALLRLLWLGPLLVAFVMVLMSFEDPFRVALAALLLLAQLPLRRWIHSHEPAFERLALRWDGRARRSAAS